MQCWDNILLVISKNTCNFKQFKNFAEIYITISGHFTPEQFVISKLCWINSCITELAKLNSYILTIHKLSSISKNKGNPHISENVVLKFSYSMLEMKEKICTEYVKVDVNSKRKWKFDTYDLRKFVLEFRTYVVTSAFNSMVWNFC